MKDRLQKKSPLKKKQPLSTSVVWILILALVFFYIFNFFSRDKTTTISYSEFKEQVSQQKVAEVVVKGNQVSGKFRGQYWEVSTDQQDSTAYEYFETIIPASIQDTELIDLLEDNNVTIKARQESDNWWRTILIFVLPWLLIIGYFWYMSRRMRKKNKGLFGGGGLFNIGKSKAKRYRKSSIDISFDDVAGLKNAKQDLREIIGYLKDPSKFKKLGADIPKGILLMGAPGTGKTLLARAAAGEADVPFFSISGSEFIEMLVGVGASRVRDMFNTAKKEAPAIIFIDEIDSVGRSRGTGVGGGHDEREQTLNQILSEMDGFKPHQSVIVLPATKRPDVLDPALTRPGRFDRQITLQLPQRAAREQILKIHTREVPLAKNVSLKNIAARTVGFSGADLKNLVNEAALLAGRKNHKRVSKKDFDQARDKILLGAKREEKIQAKEKKMIAYHESGHALLAYELPHADPLQKVTIIPRGRSLGVTEQIPEQDRHNLSRQYLLDRISVSLGGRAAEKIVFEDFTNGAANDLKQVTQLARRMVTQWGMSDKIGPVTFKQGENHPFLGKEIAQPKDFSEHMAKIIDEEVQRIVSEGEERALSILKKNRKRLDKLAQVLQEKETLEKEAIEEILGNQSTQKSKSGKNKQS